MRGRVAIVTGANSGIGLETTRGLARLGATVVMACRRHEAGRVAAQQVAADVPSADLHVMRLNLASFADVRRFAWEVQAKFPAIHVLINNAGIYTGRRETTDDGHERTWQVNHLGHFLLTLLLLDRLKASAPARIVNVASRAHRWGRIDFENLEGQRHWNGVEAYGRSKRANIVFAKELSRRLEGSGVTANAMHPGVVATNWARHGGGWLQAWANVGRPFMISARRGADTVVWLASSPDLVGVSGKYFQNRRERRPDPQCTDAEVGRRLWLASEQAVAPHLGAPRQGL